MYYDRLGLLLLSQRTCEGAQLACSHRTCSGSLYMCVAQNQRIPLLGHFSDHFYSPPAAFSNDANRSALTFYDLDRVLLPHQTIT